MLRYKNKLVHKNKHWMSFLSHTLLHDVKCLKSERRPRHSLQSTSHPVQLERPVYTHTHAHTHTHTHTRRFRLWTWSHSHKKCKAVCKCEPCSSCWRSGSYTGFIARCVHSLILSSIFSRPISCSQTHPNFALSDSIQTTSKVKSGLLFF